LEFFSVSVDVQLAKWPHSIIRKQNSICEKQNKKKIESPALSKHQKKCSTKHLKNLKRKQKLKSRNQSTLLLPVFCHAGFSSFFPMFFVVFLTIYFFICTLFLSLNVVYYKTKESLPIVEECTTAFL